MIKIAYHVYKKELYNLIAYIRSFLKIASTIDPGGASLVQRMFHGNISANVIADQLSAQFHERHNRVVITNHQGTSLVQIGSQNGTPINLNIADTEGGVLITMSQDRDWIDTASDIGGMIERAAAGKPLSIVAMIPEVLGEIGKKNLPTQIWDAINDICSLSRSLAGEKNAPQNPRICQYCQTPNDSSVENCISCGAALPVEFPRVCPKCKRQHTSDALFCQACGTRLVEG
jgi:hypothetical protein